MNQAEGLALSLNQQVVVGAVGLVCARALEGMGVIPDVVPRAPSMRSLINAVAEYFESRTPSDAFHHHSLAHSF
jgi:uroporphyrinogen-III synthase